MIGQQVSFLAVVGGLVGLQVVLQRRLGIDDHLETTGHVHDRVGPEAAPGDSNRVLGVVVDVLLQARELQYVPQLLFGPLAPDVGRPQRLAETPGDLLERGDLRGQALVGPCPLLLDRVGVLTQLLEALADGPYEAVDGLLALFEFGRTQLPLVVELFLGLPLSSVSVLSLRTPAARPLNWLSSCSRAVANSSVRAW